MDGWIGSLLYENRNLFKVFRSLILLPTTGAWSLIFPDAEPFPSHPNEPLMTRVLVGWRHDPRGEAALDVGCLLLWEALQVSGAGCAAAVAGQDGAPPVLLTPPPACHGAPESLALLLCGVGALLLLPAATARPAGDVMDHTDRQDGASQQE